MIRRVWRSSALEISTLLYSEGKDMSAVLIYPENSKHHYQCLTLLPREPAIDAQISRIISSVSPDLQSLKTPGRFIVMK